MKVPVHDLSPKSETLAIPDLVESVRRNKGVRSVLKSTHRLGYLEDCLKQWESDWNDSIPNGSVRRHWEELLRQSRYRSTLTITRANWRSSLNSLIRA